MKMTYWESSVTRRDFIKILISRGELIKGGPSSQSSRGTQQGKGVFLFEKIVINSWKNFRVKVAYLFLSLKSIL